MAEERVRVAVRIRSLLPRELLHKHRVCVHAAPDNKQVIVGTDQQFPFDYVFGPAVSQTEVYESCVQPLVKSLLDGYNATVFCYGQTGSGKTYTLGGKNLDEEGGIIERVAEDVFTLLSGPSEESVKFTVQVSYLELYMEELRDLLQLETNPKELHIRDDDRGLTVVVGAKEIVVTSPEELLSIVKEGNALRHTGCTGMNERSSRSHAILILQVSQCCSPSKSVSSYSFLSKLCLVDLAGSERAGKTGNTGARFKESVFINTDLLALSKVIRALSDPSQRGSNIHIPYRDSKITRLLRDSLGGTAHTLMITCVSPSNDNIAETLCALQFASRARHIRNRPGEICAHPDASMCPTNPEKHRIQELQEELHRLKEALRERDEDMETDRAKSGPAVGWVDDSSQGKVPDTNGNGNQEEKIQLCMLVQQAADLLADFSSGNPNPSIKQRLEDWQDRRKVLNYLQHAEEHGLKDNVDQPPHLTILQLRRELSRCQEALSIEKEVMNNKNAQLQMEVEQLNQKCKTHLQAAREEKMRTEMQTEQLVDQQALIEHLRADLLALQEQKPDNQIMCGQPHGSEASPQIDSSPASYSVERQIKSFRVRNQLLLAKTEENCEVYLPFVQQQAEDKDGGQDEDTDSEDRNGFRRSLNSTWTRRQRLSAQKHRHAALEQASDGVPSKEKWHDGHWLELEEERVLQRRAELQELEEELRRREEVLQQREACLQQKSQLEVKKCSSSQALSQDLLHVSLKLETLNEQLESSSRVGGHGGVTTEELERERDALRLRRDALDAQLKDNRVLTAEEEHSLLELDEAVNILDVAMQFKNRSIQDKQQRLSIEDSLSCSSEPVQLCNVTKKLKELSTHEASELLIRYFNKVVCLRESENHLRLRCNELELRGAEQEAALKEMEASLQRLPLAADRRLTQQQQDHQSSIQQLLHKLRGERGALGESGMDRDGMQTVLPQGAQTRLQHLEKELSFYKSSSSQLKRKLRELHSDGQQGLSEADAHSSSHAKASDMQIRTCEPLTDKVRSDRAKMNRTHNSCSSLSSDPHAHKKTKVPAHPQRHTQARHLGESERGRSGEEQMRRVCLSRRQLRQIFPKNAGSRRSTVDTAELMQVDNNN